MATTERNRPSESALAIEAMLGRVKTERDTLPPDTMIGGFVLREVLQRDDISVLYGATASASGAAVCIEEYLPSALVLRAEDRTLRLRTPADEPAFAAGAAAFRQEAEQLAALDHPALMRIGPLWEAHGTWYRLVPWLEGDTLAAVRAADGSPPTDAELRRWLLPVLAALDAVHASGRVHGDVRPGKLLRKRDGQVQLRDFNAARAAIAAIAPWRVQWPEGECRPLELAEALAAGPSVSSPAGAVGPWSDLYALAASVFWLVTGQAPVAAALRAEGQPAPTFAEAADHLRHRGFPVRYADGLVMAIDAALQLQPSARPQSVAAFRALLETPALPDSKPEPLRDLMTDPKAMPTAAAAGADLRTAAAPQEPGWQPSRQPPHDDPQEPVWSPQPLPASGAAVPFPIDLTGTRIDPNERSQRAMAAFRAVRDSDAAAGTAALHAAPPAARWPWAIGGLLAGALLAGSAVFWWLQPSVSEADRLMAEAAARDQAAVEAVMRAPSPPPQAPTAQAAPAPADAPSAAASASTDATASALPGAASAAASAERSAAAGPFAGLARADHAEAAAPQTGGASASATAPASMDKPATEPIEEVLTDQRATPSGAGAQPGTPPDSAGRSPIAGGDAAQRPSAATKQAPGTRTAVAQAPTAPATPSAVCAPRTNFSLYQCMQTQCRQDRFFSHPECIRLRLKDEMP